MADDVEIEMSPLCCSFESGGIVVQVDIYHIPGEEWTLEVIDEHRTSIVWDGTFASDEAALAEFNKDVREESLARIVEGDD